MIKMLLVARGQALLSAMWIMGKLARMTRQRPAYWRFIARKVRRYGLFEATYYLGTNADVSVSGLAPEYHFAAYGDREGRHPLPLFDPAYYRSQVRGCLVRINSLMHCMLVGRHKGISPSPWFDISYYLANNKDVARSGKDPLHHYLRYGGLEGRSPSKQFDGAFYLQANPDVAMGGLHPLLHYLQIGRLENRPIRPMERRHQKDETYVLPSERDWKDCVGRAGNHTIKVDVIVPVYKGRAETLRCLLSVLKAPVETRFELIVINDASPDADLVADLEALAGRGLFTLLHNAGNSGFVATVNRGMALHPDRDVLLLNSDTEVYNDWLDRLTAAAYRDERTGTVTPLSNNATICSYPQFLHDNPYPLEIPYAELDGLTASVNRGIEVDVPTGVGFYMYIRRDCLERTGLFDDKAFRHGYGEENDFCQRAIRGNWRNVIAADIFVRHLGAVSFEGEKGKHLARAMTVLSRLHPNYHEDVRQFIKADPLKAARARLDWARVKRGVRGRNVLIVCHNRGGGAERHVQEDTRFEIEHGSGVFYLRPVGGDASRVRISSPQVAYSPNMESFSLSAPELARRMKELGISRIQNYGMVDFEADAPVKLLDLAKDMGIPLWFDIHDYKVICPRINLASRNGQYCGEPDEHVCNKCLRTEGNDFDAKDIRQWRELHYQALSGAAKVLVPDADVADRLSRYFPDVAVTISPHEEIDVIGAQIRKTFLQADEPLRIAVIGAIGKIKGYDILHACAQDAKKRQLPLEFVLMGYSLNDRALERAGVTVTGRYLETEAEAKLRGLAPDVVWLPSLWPETYSYTLSLALMGGYGVFAFDIGAIAARLRRAELTQFIIPLSMINDIQGINDRFLAIRSENIVANKKRA